LPEKYPDWKFIIAPHEIDSNHIESIEKQFSGSLRLSTLGATENSQAQILIIDNIGMLSSLYRYGKLAYIGGGFGAGIHNTLEAVAFGLPVIFGPKYEKFQEAKDLIALGSAQSISDTNGLEVAFNKFKDNTFASEKAKKYVQEKKGSTDQIIEMITKPDQI